MTLSPYLGREDAAPVEGWEDAARGLVQWRTLLSGDRTPTDTFTLGVAEVDAAPARLHRHAQAELYYVLSGRGVMRLEDGDHPLEPGGVVFIPGGAWHGAHAAGAAPLKLLYVLAADSFADVVYEFAEAD